MSRTRTNIAGAFLFLILTTAAHAAGPGTGKGTATGSTSNQSSSQSQTQGASGSTNPPFESVMLAYGALDQTMQSLAHKTCLVAKTTDKPSLILIVDQASLSNVQAYASFAETARFLELSFKKMASSLTPPVDNEPRARFNAATGVDKAADIISAFATILVASNTESASTITITDLSAALKLFAYLKNDCDCKTATVKYPAISGSDSTAIESIFTELANDRTAALARIPKENPQTSAQAAAFNNLDGSYNQFLQSAFAINSITGQSGLTSVIQGYGVATLLDNKEKQVYEVYVNVAAAGGTERVKKNVITALVTGDWISYSGGVVVNTMIIKKPADISKPAELLYADVLRYRTPLTAVEMPINKNSSSKGDNLSDTPMR